MAVTPLGSCTRSRVTWKTRPLKTVLDDKTFSCGGELDCLECARRVLWALLLLAAMESTIKQVMRAVGGWRTWVCYAGRHAKSNH